MKEQKSMEGLAARRTALKVIRQVTEEGAYASLALDAARKGADLLKSIGMEISYHSGAIANSMAMIYHAMGDYENALACFNKSADIIFKVFGDCGLYRSILQSAETVKAKMK